MGFLPKAMGTRPRLACEIRAEGVVAARADEADGALSAVERVACADGGPGRNRAGATGVDLAEMPRAEKVNALRKALDAVSGRGREVTLVVPDTAARVLLIDFDELPAKIAEALPVVRFRLKKLLPFDADDAAVSYQVMSQTRAGMQVLAVAMPREALADYESLVREAGYEPGAVLPSTLAALAGLEEDAGPSLVVNAGRESATTAMVKGGVLLLHRTIHLNAREVVTAVAPVAATMTAMRTDEDGAERSRDVTISAIAARFAAMEGQTTPAPRAPEAPQVSRVGSALASGMMPSSSAGETAVPPERAAGDEIGQAVKVAAAYFEDTLGEMPQVILSAGTLGADSLARMLGAGMPRVEEMVRASAGGVPAGWLAGVQGALKS